MNRCSFQTPILIGLAAVFTLGLTFASIELPYLVDEILINSINTPDIDTHADNFSDLKAELFIQHYYLRIIGYVCLSLTIFLIVVGFASRKTGFAVVGAFAFMLPVFAQFAGVMFFLAGLGILNVLWLPVLDVSFELSKLGLIIRLPFDLLNWLLQQIGISGYWPLVYFFILSGLGIFFLGTLAWLLARSRGSNVADFWVYRISRHPQYLGWILWSYGIYLLLLRGLYPKRSWGIDASLPWLLSTMVIVGVALIEELNMKQKFGTQYANYHRTAPFLFPVPGVIARLFYFPLRIFHANQEPQKKREVVFLILFYGIVLVGASTLFYAGGLARFQAVFQTQEILSTKVEKTIKEMNEETNPRQRYFISRQLVALGEPAIPQLIDLLEHKDLEIRGYAIEILGQYRAREAVPQLIESLGETDENIRLKSMVALAEIGASEAKKPITRFLDAPNPGIRLVAIRSLAQLGADEIVEKILPDLLHPEPSTRARIAEALGILGSEKAVPGLIANSNDQSPWVRRTIIVALTKIGSPAAYETLLRATKDVDWEVRIYASEGLRRGFWNEGQKEKN